MTLQQTQLSLTNRATHLHLCKRNGVADLKHADAPRMSYQAELGRSALNGVGIHTGELQKWGALELRCLGMGGMDDLKLHAPPRQVLQRQIW